MDALFRLLLTNAAAAGLLAIAAWAASRLVKRPAVVHGLWLLALAKLVTPPMVPLPVLPGGPPLPGPETPAVVRIAPRAAVPSPLVEEAPVRSAAPPAPASTHASESGGQPAPATEPRGAGWELASRLVLVVGVMATLVLTAWRFVRFRRLLEHALPAPPAVTARALEIAHRLGLRRAPPVLLVPARIPPMLWPASGGPRLLIPDELLPQLDDEERDALLAHELAHVRRRDHWVRLLEVAATALFWWYPVTWWARRALRSAEERCCDEWVLRLLPASAGAYAEGLLKSLNFVSREGVSLPVAASGVGPARDLETRLKEILMTKPLPQLNAPLRLALAAGAAVGLAVFPTQAQSPAADRDAPEVQAAPAPASTPRAAAPAIAARPAPRPAPATPAPQAVEPAPARSATSTELVERKLEARRRAIEKERQELRERQRALEGQALELESRAEQEEMQAEAAKLRAEGNPDRAALVERKIAAAKRRVEVQRRRLKLEAEHAALEARLEQAGQAREDRIQALVEAGREAEADQLKHEMETAQAGEERASQELRKKQEAIEREMGEAEEQMQGLAAEEHVHELRAGTDELVRSLTEQVAALKEELPQATAQKAQLEREIRRLEAAIAALAKTP